MFVPQPLATLDAHSHLDRHDGIRQLLEISRRAGIQRINIVCIPGSPERCLTRTSEGMLAKALHPETVFVFGGLLYHLEGPPTAEDLLRQVEQLHEAGCDGVKMLESKPSTRKRIPYRTDDPIYAKFFGYLQEHRIPILWHVADPETFWDPSRISPAAKRYGWDYTDGTYPSREQLYDEIDNVLTSFPNLRIVFAHFYFLSRHPERAARFLDRWPQVSFDITPGAEMYRNFSDDPEHWHTFFTKYQDRILFGTDNHIPSKPWPQSGLDMVDKVRMIRQFLETTGRFEGFGTATRSHVEGIGLERSVLEKIYQGNFEKFVGTAPRPLRLEAVRAHCRRVMTFAKRTSGQEKVLGEMAAIEKILKTLPTA